VTPADNCEGYSQSTALLTALIFGDKVFRLYQDAKRTFIIINKQSSFLEAVWLNFNIILLLLFPALSCIQSRFIIEIIQQKEFHIILTEWQNFCEFHHADTAAGTL